MNFRLIFVLFTSAVLFVGCATSPVGPAKKAGINAVKVEPRVNIEAMRFGQVQGGNLNAALTALVLDAITSKQLTEMTAMMHDNKIDVPQLVRERFELAMKSEPGLVHDETNANGTFILRVRQHGFDDVGLSLSKKAPFVVVIAELQDARGKRIWSSQANNRMTPKNVGATWSEYKADPARLKQDWETQIDIVVRALLCLK